MTRSIAALYVRVSTSQQTVERQLRALHEYADRELPECEHIDVVDRATGTDTDREGYQHIMQSTDELDHVVVHEVSRLARSIADFDSTVEQLHDAGTSVHIVSEGLHLPADDTDPYSRALAQLLGVFAELDAAIIRDRVQQGLDVRLSDPEYHHGPAPLGYDKDDGRLVPTHEYPAVCRVLAAVESEDMTVTAAADTLDTSRKTIHRALQHPERYELDPEPPADPEHPHGWMLPP